MNQLKQEVRQFIEENFLLGAAGVELGDTDSFLDRHVLDSTGFLELIAHLEERYGIKVGDEEMVPENLDSIDNVVRFVTRKRAS